MKTIENTIQSIVDNTYDTFFLIAGPCAVESYDICAEVAEKLIDIQSQYQVPIIFKASYKKANRSRHDSFSTIGEDKAIDILRRIRKNYEIPITSDVHEVREVESYGQLLDVIQVPAFLCRQTALLQACGKAGHIVNIKKGQFLSGNSMRFAIEKVKTSNPNCTVWATERGNSFGYEQLVVDARNLVLMQSFADGVIMDCTHATQRVNRSEGVSGGNVKEIETFVRMAISLGVNGLFIETHPQPAQALSDGANMLPLPILEDIVKKSVSLSKAVKATYA